jgi:hypothetical protein
MGCPVYWMVLLLFDNNKFVCGGANYLFTSDRLTDYPMTAQNLIERLRIVTTKSEQ